MADWYATQAGAGSADGTSLANAWALASVDWTASGVEPADTLNLSGTLTGALTVGDSGTSGSPITVTGGTFARTVGLDVTVTQDYVTLDGVDVSRNGGTSVGYFINGASTGVIFKNATLDGNEQGNTAIELAGDAINDLTIQNITASGWTRAGTGAGIRYANGTNSTNAANWLIEDSSFAVTSLASPIIGLAIGSGVTGSALTDVTIRNCTLSGTTGANFAIDTSMATAAATPTIARHVYEGNTIKDCGGGIQIEANDTLIRWNVVTNMTQQAAINTIDGDNQRVCDNYVDTVDDNNAGDGHGYVWTGSNYRIERNWASNLTSSRVSPTIHAACYVWAQTDGGQSTPNEECHAEGNVGITARHGLRLRLGNGTSGAQYAYQNTLANISVNGFWIADGTSSDTVRAKNNIFHGNSGTASYVDDTASAIVEDIDYNAASGFTTEALPGSNNVTADPSFRNLSGNDVRLNGDSPCIAAGVEWWSGEPPHGEDGRRFCAPPSMGAYEYFGGGTAGAIPARVKPAGVDIAKARAA